MIKTIGGFLTHIGFSIGISIIITYIVQTIIMRIGVVGGGFILMWIFILTVTLIGNFLAFKILKKSKSNNIKQGSKVAFYLLLAIGIYMTWLFFSNIFR